MEYNDLEQLKQDFVQGNFDFPQEFMLQGIKYKISRTSGYSMEEMIASNYKAYWMYTTSYREQAMDKGLNQVCALIWGFQEGYRTMEAFDVRMTALHKISVPMREGEQGSINIPKEKIVGDIVDVMITSIPNSNVMKGKVDTGADVSSIHAEEWDIDNGQVTFICPELSENRITLPVIEKQAIRSSNGDVEYRPVVELSIKVNDQSLTNIMFNLNDRGKMSYPMLVGQNILEKGGFMIDPTINDPDAPIDEEVEFDWEAVNEEFKDTTKYIVEDTSDNKLAAILKIIDTHKG